MMTERNKRLFKGVAADGVFQLSQMVIQFAAVPLLLYFWGVALYGEWLLITALPAFLAISDFGFTHVTARQMVMQVADGDQEGALATFQSSSILVGVTSGVIALAFFLLISLLPVAATFSISRIGSDDLVIIAALLGIKIIISMQSGMMGGALQATGHYPLFFMWLSGVFVGEFLLFASIVATDGGPVMAAGAMLAAAVAGMVVLRIMIGRLAPWFQFGLSSFRFEIVRKLAKPAFAALSFPASNALNFQGTRLIIGSVLGPAAVALFATHRQLAGFVTQTNIFGKSMNVELGLAYGANDMASYRRLSLQIIQILFWISLAAAIAIGIAAWFLFPSWTGGRLQFDPLLFILLLTGAVGEAIWRAAFQPASATNRHIYLAKIALIFTVAMLPLMYVLCHQYELIGVATALLVCVGPLLVYAVRNALVLTGAGVWELLGYVLHPPMRLLFQYISSSGLYDRNKRSGS